MSHRSFLHSVAAILPLFVMVLAGCSDPRTEMFDPATGKHAAGWAGPDVHGASATGAADGPASFSACQGCHGPDFSGGISKTSCYTCHGVSAPHPSAWRTGTRTHQTTDASNAPVCAGCHANGANSPVPLVSPAPTGTAPGCFNNTLCHGQGHAAGWANPDQHGASAKSQANGFSGCKSCHGSGFNGSGSAPTCLNTAACHGATVNAPHSPTPWRTSPGSTRTHTVTNEGNASVCADCHTLGAHLTSVPVPTNLVAGTPGCFNSTLCHGQAGHAAGWASPGAHGAAAKSVPSVSAMQGFSTCQTCHGATFAGGTAVTCLNNAACHGTGVSSPHAKAPWASSLTSTLTHTTTTTANAGICGLCHWNNRQPPSYLTPVPGTPNCFDNTLCHGPAASIGCVNCHAAVIDAPNVSIVSGGTVTQRRAVVAEFASTWSHKRSASGAVTDEDCVVCHMEGNAGTKKRDLAYHGNGYIDLRDPDSGTQVLGVTWNNATPGSYVSSASTVSFVRFSRNLGAALENDPNWLVDAAIQINHCLKCHDADGALSANARVTGGVALRPFNTAITGHTAPFDSNGTGNVVNVNASFATANAAYHPVSGKQNNSYVQGARAVAPWNMTKTNGNATSWGNLMSCWDCHAPAGATGVQTRTVTAHGGPATLRAPVYAGGNTAATNLCLVCHATTYATTAGNHGAGSAYATGGSAGNMTATIMQRCHNCHAYTAAVGGTIPATTFASRPLRAENVHGFNDRDPVTAGVQTWATSNVRPYAFIRNTLSVWAPATVGGTAPPSAHTCTGTGGTCGTDMNGDSFTPGGVY